MIDPQILIKKITEDTLNGIPWEYTIQFCPDNCSAIKSGCVFDCPIKNVWKDYHLGDEINNNFIYRPKNKGSIVLDFTNESSLETGEVTEIQYTQEERMENIKNLNDIRLQANSMQMKSYVNSRDLYLNR